MARKARRETMAADEIGIFHCFNRCAQQLFLCGMDPVTGEDYSHRKPWMIDKLRELLREFAIELFLYSLMSNHLHLLLRNRPDLVAQWDDLEVALRWLRCCPLRRDEHGRPCEPRPSDLMPLLRDADKLLELRGRLSDPSWLMRLWCQYIAQRANRESQKHGHFFEGRYRAERLDEEASRLACALYIDLNLVRAGLCQTPEESLFTSVHDRLMGRQARIERVTAGGLSLPSGDQSVVDLRFARRDDPDGWLGPLTIDAEQRLAKELAAWFPAAAEIC